MTRLGPVFLFGQTDSHSQSDSTLKTYQILGADAFKVTNWTERFLKILGIDATEGDFVTYKTLESSYTRLILKTHPDKDSSEFIKINTAYRHIRSELDSNEEPQERNNRRYQMLSHDMREETVFLKEIRQEVSDMIKAQEIELTELDKLLAFLRADVDLTSVADELSQIAQSYNQNQSY